MPKPDMINQGSNTESFITGYRSRAPSSDRYIKYLKVIDDQVFTDFYTCGEKIGQGNFGTVYEAKDKKDKKSWAMKIIVKHSLSSSLMKGIEREIQILKMLYHPHIIELHEVLESSHKIYLVLEKCDCDLLSKLKQVGRFTEMDTKRIVRDLASAVAYLHRKDIVHRDIKVENILLIRNPQDVNDKLFIKLSDFGLSIIKSGRKHTNMLHDRCGTLNYMAPEMLTAQSYSQQCDVWAIGIIMYLLLKAELPFTAKTDAKVTEQICNAQPSFAGMDVTEECKDLMLKVLDKNPASRTTASEILVHPWLHGEKLKLATQSNNILDMMRMWNKDLRAPLVGQNNDIWLGGPAVKRAFSPVVPKEKAPVQSVPVSVQNLQFNRQSVDKSRRDAPPKWTPPLKSVEKRRN